MLRLLLLLAVFPAFVPTSTAETYTVTPDGSGDFPSIQAAINAATSGDLILLSDGEFSGSGNRDISFMGKTLTVRASSGDPDLCSIDCQGSSTEPHRAFLLVNGEGPGTTLEAITIRNGSAFGSNEEKHGGAIFCSGANIAIALCRFVHCEAQRDGGSVYASGANLSIQECGFANNIGGVSGGALSAHNSTLNVSSCDFVENLSPSGGGINIEASQQATISECEFRGNGSSIGYGGAIESIGPTSVESCSFYENSAFQGGAVFSWTTIVISNCVFGWNSSDAGTVFDQGEGTVIDQCTFFSNQSDTVNGIIGSGTGELRIVNTIIAFGSDGRALGGSAVLLCCDVFGNHGGDYTHGFASQLGVNGNISQDPIFCGPADENFSLADLSPCAAENNPECGQIGTFGIGCSYSGIDIEDASPATTTWGQIKTIYLGEHR